MWSKWDPQMIHMRIRNGFRFGSGNIAVVDQKWEHVLTRNGIRIGWVMNGDLEQESAHSWTRSGLRIGPGIVSERITNEFSFWSGMNMDLDNNCRSCGPEISSGLGREWVQNWRRSGLRFGSGTVRALTQKRIVFWTTNGFRFGSVMVLVFYKAMSQNCARNGIRFGAGIDSDVDPKWDPIWTRKWHILGQEMEAVLNENERRI